MVDGLVPNRPAEAGRPGFAAADTTLWLFEAARLMADALGDTHPFVTDELLLALRDAFDAALPRAPPRRSTSPPRASSPQAAPATR